MTQQKQITNKMYTGTEAPRRQRLCLHQGLWYKYSSICYMNEWMKMELVATCFAFTLDFQASVHMHCSLEMKPLVGGGTLHACLQGRVCGRLWGMLIEEGKASSLSIFLFLLSYIFYYYFFNTFLHLLILEKEEKTLSYCFWRTEWWDCFRKEEKMVFLHLKMMKSEVMSSKIRAFSCFGWAFKEHPRWAACLPEVQSLPDPWSTLWEPQQTDL